MVDLITSLGGRIALPLRRILAPRVSRFQPGRRLIRAPRVSAAARARARRLRAQLAVAPGRVVSGHIRLTSN
ncbi:MAG TPA: hypothetical protein VHZ97_31345 [Pseudonocardiaceae bacterium]|nr:hypothetical protein [Pseudonocardiaceae bacterium]